MRVLNHLELAGPLERSGIRTSVDQQRAALSDNGVDVVTSPWNGGGPLAAARRALSGNGPFVDFDLAHVNLFGPGSVAVAALARRRGVPLVAHAHSTREDFYESFRGSDLVAPALGPYLRWFYSLADVVVCPSPYTRDLLESYPVDARTEVVSNGVDLDSLAGHGALRAEYRDRYDLEGTVVFCVGNVFERKGLSTFCRVAQASDHEFAWFGHYDTGPLASRTVRRWTRDPPENVTFTGWVEDKRGAFGAGDVFMFASKEENQGIVVLEAMACGKAVVLRDIPAYDEYYTDGEDCLKCETEAEFGAALDRLADDPDLRERLGEAARETARGHSLDDVGEELVEIYRAALDA